MGPQGIQKILYWADNTDLIQSGTNKCTNSDFITKRLSTDPIFSRPSGNFSRPTVFYLMKASVFLCEISQSTRFFANNVVWSSKNFSGPTPKTLGRRFFPLKPQKVWFHRFLTPTKLLSNGPMMLWTNGGSLFLTLLVESFTWNRNSDTNEVVRLGWYSLSSAVSDTNW